MIQTTYKYIKDVKIERLNIITLLSVTALIVLYLITANSVATANYRKIIIQKYIDSLKTEVRTLNLELADKRSIGYLQKAIADLNLVVNESIQYVEITGPVAKNP